MIRNVTNLVRGALVGAAEAIPGVSGGTIALVTGIYESLINSAGHVVSGAKDLVRGRRSEAAAQFRQAQWGVVIPVLIGMVAGLLTAAKLIEPMVTEHPQGSRAVFFGMVLVSLVVPFQMVRQSGGWRPASVLIGIVMAAVAFVLTGLAASEAEPSAIVIAPMAAIAIWALVLPGVSGSFILLSVGLYEPTLRAVNERDIGYIAIFGLGAAIGLVVAVKVLQWLLEHRRHITLVVMTGLMAGSLRSLWPWQDDDRALRLPDDGVPATFGLLVLGAAIVVALLVAETVQQRRQAPNPVHRQDQPTSPPVG